MTTPDLLATLDEKRAQRLRAMKRNAVGLLVLAAIVFIATHVFTEGSGGWGYVQAAAEAAMVGGVADWFAVTALFRHPLGIPIPHTALIPRSKDAIGRGLGEFVQRNFMNPTALVERIRAADPAGRIGEWLAEPANATAALGMMPAPNGILLTSWRARARQPKAPAMREATSARCSR